MDARTWVVLGACLLATAGASSAASRTGTLTVTLKSGTPQSAHAFVAARAARYETAFDEPLAVAVHGPDGSLVRFRCATPDCEFSASDQPESVTRVDRRTYDVKSTNGVAAVKVTISTLSPETVTVAVRPANGGTRAAIRFVLTAR